MSKPRRKPPTLREKLAATLLMLSRVDERGDLVPVIPREEALQMTTAQILARFEFDHGIYVAWHGGNHPTNLTPRLKEKHREKTKRDVKAIAKVRRGVKRRQQADADRERLTEFFDACKPRRPSRRTKRPMQYTAMKDTHKRTFAGKVVPR